MFPGNLSRMDLPLLWHATNVPPKLLLIDLSVLVYIFASDQSSHKV